jgi:DNA (cytosine-5)-methyltransferase 1
MKAIELFAGAGGLGMGISKAGFQPAAVVEWDRWCCDTLRANRARKVGPLANWPEPIEGDVRGVDFAKFEGCIALVSGGPPCQPFSLGGKHQAHDDDRDMWPEAVRAVRQTRPKAFIFENVKGLTRASFASYFNYILLQLHYPSLARRSNEDWIEHNIRLQRHHTSRSARNEEYRVVAQLLNAADYGVPQRRERVVFVGFRADLGIEWSFPNPTHSYDSLLWDQCRTEAYWDRHQVKQSERTLNAKAHIRGMLLEGKPKLKAWRTTRDAIGDLPDPERDAMSASKIANHKFQSGARSYHGHTGSPLDEPAKTLKAGVHGVPGGENMLLKNDGTVRYFTVRECARLQTFPDSIRFHGSWSETMRQLGNAVPVTLAEVVARNVAAHLKSSHA